ncbi:MAG: hypoxanthine phosphoribosyltransferase [Oscillospiraceae bacterium]|nr:hypoxanthine phosphoribosyltransferase [Oscillospiraceae bacterium]
MVEAIGRILVSEEQISARMEELGRQISEDYQGKELMLVCVLKGSFLFAADLMRKITVPCQIDFMCVSSYSGGVKSSGLVKILKDVSEPIEGKDILIIEDILDSGLTLSHLTQILKMRKPASIQVCTLLNKPGRREALVYPYYTGFTVPDEFVIGYGLDYDEKYRNLPYIASLT